MYTRLVESHAAGGTHVRAAPRSQEVVPMDVATQLLALAGGAVALACEVVRLVRELREGRKARPPKRRRARGLRKK